MANIILNGEKMKPFSLKSEARQNFPLLLLSSNRMLEFLPRAIRQGKEIKGEQVGKEEVKLYLFSEYVILYLKDCKDSTKKVLALFTYYKIAGYKINIYRKQ
jgi:hypothetical protein